eukprot:TRINITY_DN552_c0_g1_i1.p1 TRINITY_DN552_c0_g1~~TRINITY_DN552_c0_g1_i1.p1  ORF type:complete len:284 (-),score=41.97 TRINITY_DN552_c0_g1_i1:27-878(-)
MALPVYLYVPNLIGYFRVICSFVSYYFALTGYSTLFLVFYMTSFLLDAADGYYARKLNQCSKMGAVLDMITDRFSTAGVCMILCTLYTSVWWRLAFIALMALDLCSHYAQMYSSLSHGQTSHKNVDSNLGLLHLYYTNRNVLGLVCFSAEVWYVLLYVQSVWTSTKYVVPGLGVTVTIPYFLWLLSIPLFALKQYLNFKQLATALLSLDAPAARKSVDEDSWTEVDEEEDVVAKKTAARVISKTPAPGVLVASRSTSRSAELESESPAPSATRSRSRSQTRKS